MVSANACKSLQILRSLKEARGIHAERTSAVESPHIGVEGPTLHWFLNVKKSSWFSGAKKRFSIKPEPVSGFGVGTVGAQE